MFNFSENDRAVALQECENYQLSTGTGSPSDREIAESQLATYASWALPKLVAYVEELEKRQPMQYPEDLTPELDEVLGWPLFKCGPFAHVFQKAGHNIPRKAEREQAFIHHWLIKLVLRHGAKWADVAQQELKALMPSAEQEGGEGK
jgi:hypothetical protein